MLTKSDFAVGSLSHQVLSGLIENGYWTLYYIRNAEAAPAALLYERNSEDPSLFAVEFSHFRDEDGDFVFRKAPLVDATHFILFTSEDYDGKRWLEKYAGLIVSDEVLTDELRLDGIETPPASYIGILSLQEYATLEMRLGTAGINSLFVVIPAVQVR